MTLSLDAEPLPLLLDADGVVRVGGTRVTLDTVVAAFRDGATAEEVALQYPSLDLGDMYAAVAYYLRHRPEVDAYLDARRRLGETVRGENEARLDPRGIRARLLVRRSTRPEWAPLSGTGEMLKLAADENFSGDVVRGLQRRSPALDVVRVQDAGLSGADDRPSSNGPRGRAKS